MARLRRPQLLLLLLLVASIVVMQGTMVPMWQKCGIMTFCIVHKSCIAETSTEKGWTILKNSGTYPAGYSGLGSNYSDSNCQRFISMRPVTGGIDIEVIIWNRINNVQFDVKLLFKSQEVINPEVTCSNINTRQVPGNTNLNGKGMSLHDQRKSDSVEPGCKFLLRLHEAGADIRKKITELSSVKVEIGSNDDKDSSGPKMYAVDGVDLTTLKMLCEDNQIAAVIDHVPYNAIDSTEITNNTHPELVPKNTKYCENGHSPCHKLDDNAKVQCPPEFPMKHRTGLDPNTWAYVKDGLVCRKGQLTHAHDENRAVVFEDGIKCSRKKCSTCDAPVFAHQTETHVETPAFEPAIEGDRCRALKCPNHGLMMVTLKGIGRIMHKKNTLECSASNGALTEQNWDAEGDNRGELVDALCTDDVYCTKMHPLGAAECKKGDEDCHEAIIIDKYESTGPCNGNFTLQYIAHGSENKVLLSEFYCKTEDGKWFARNKAGVRVDILDNSKLVCRRKEKDVIHDRRDAPFLGSVAFWVFLGGIGLVVIAIIVVGAFLIVRSKKQKERKKKAMASVSQTFKEPHKNDKKRKHDDRKKRQVSVVNSVTGDTDSGPGSQSGGGSTAGSVPIAPPSKLFSPTKGFSKPDKGCAVLDLQTGESKNLRWTNHAGDGPPTQRQPDNTSNNYATSHSKQDDIQSAIKFAPEEQAALKKAGKDAQLRKKKEKSRQKSIEYNLGYPKPVQNEGSKRAKNWMTSDVPAVEESKGVDESTTMK